MRCDTEISFVTDGERVLDTDPTSEGYGGYVDGGETAVAMMADVTDTQTQTQQLLYGELREGSKTVRLNQQYRDSFDHIRITDRDTGESALYDVDASRHLRHRSTFVCHEVL